ncbi:MAG: LacI family DNA-binding transcriptional regulator, partial [Chloroflexota bacterium]
MPIDQDPTIYSVAKKANVSIATVSRVLNAPHLVKQETRDKVLGAIDLLGYVPKAAAQAYATKQLGRIGILTPFFTHPSFSQRMRGVGSILADNAYEMVIYPVASLNQIYHYLETIQLNRRLDGLITMALSIDDVTVDRFVRNGFPVVTIETSHPGLSSVFVNNFLGGKLAAEYLLAKGHTFFGFVGDGELPDYSLRPSDERFRGFTRTLAENGIEILDDYIINPLPRSVHKMAKALLDRHPRPSAIFASSDELAIQVMMIARRKGLHIPDELAVIGFDDLDFAGHIGLTTVNQQLDESGILAANTVLDQIKTQEIVNENFELE